MLLYGGTSSSEENIQQGTLRVLNDLFIFNIKQRLWEEPLVGGNSPPPKLFPGNDCNYPQLGHSSGEIVLVGGVDDLAKPKIPEMRLFILSQTDGQNWKVEEQNKNLLAKFGIDDEDDDEDMPQQRHSPAPDLTDQEILALEQRRSDILLHRLKEDVTEMEDNLRKERIKNVQMKENSVLNTEQAKTLEADFQVYRTQRAQEIRELSVRKDCNQTIVSNLLEALAFKQKQRKLLQARVLVLEQAMDSAEDFIVHLDRFFSDAIQQMCLDNVLKPSVFNEIVKKKEEHTQVLILFRNSYEEAVKTEVNIQEAQDKILLTLRSLNLDAVLLQKLSDKQVSLLKTFNLLKTN